MYVLEQYGNYGAFWSKRWKKLVVVQETTQSRYLGRVSTNTGLLVSLNTAASRRDDMFKADLKCRYPHNYKTVMADLYLIFMYYAIILGNKRSFTFYYSQHTVLEFLVCLERRYKTPSEICIGTPVFLPYYIYAFYSYYYYSLFDHIWVVLLVRFRINRVLMI